MLPDTHAVTLDAALQELSGELRDDIPAMVERGLAQMRLEMPEFFARDGDPDFVEVYRQSFHAQLRFIYEGLACGRELEGVDAPPLALEEARMAAARGIDLATLLCGYRITHRLILDAAIERGGDPDVLRVTSRWLFAYMDWMTRQVSAVYGRERDLLVRDRERRRRQLVRDVLDGIPIDESRLAYRLDQRHLALVAWGEAPERALEAAAQATGLALLTVAGPGATAWGWLGGAEIAGVPGARPPDGTRLALGEPGDGPDGFRASHRQALRTYGIARETTEPVTAHADVALLALALQDRAHAREFALRELGSLASDDARSHLLRATLAAYFGTGQNASSAAAVLGVHERTVTYRLRSIEERLGRPLLDRRDELALALRLAPFVLDLP